MQTQVSQESTENELDLLTAREREVLELLAQGLNIKTVADRISIAGETVRVHTKSIHRKLRVTNRVQAILVLRMHAQR